MNWYYADGTQQQGPVSEADFAQLVQAGKVTDQTMVWREGMADWQPYGNVKATTAVEPSGSVVCSECGKMFSPDDVIRYGDRAVCAACKPAFTQKLKEGATTDVGTMDYASFWTRFAAKFLDGIIMQVVNFVLGMVIGLAMAATAKSPEGQAAMLVVIYVVSFLLDIAYKAFFIGAFGATPGKMAVKIKVVNPDGSRVSYPKAIGRALAEYLSAVICLIGYIMAAFDEEKRSLHDRICSTRVVRNP